MTPLALSPAQAPIMAEASSEARIRFLEFFAAAIRNPTTRRAYARAARDFLTWCRRHGVRDLASIAPIHIAGLIEELGRSPSAPTVKQQLAAVRHLFDWLVTGQVVPFNPTSSVRGPSHSARTGRTPVLEGEEARLLLENIDLAAPTGLRDRALIALMAYSFARIGAALAMKREDVFVQGRHLWVRLHEKGGKRHEMPCHRLLDEYLTAYLDASDPSSGPRITPAPRCSARRPAGPSSSATGRSPSPTPSPSSAAAPRRQASPRGSAPHLPRHRHHHVPKERRHA